MQCRWVIKSVPDQGAAWLEADGRRLPRALAHCLAVRGIGNEEALGRFLDPRLADLTDPFDFGGMDRLVSRLRLARREGELVVLFGDYDVDGVTASALLHEVLTELGWRVECFIPNRFSEGYGLGAEALSRCVREHPTRLVMAVDCGANASDLIEAFGRQGSELLVLDHHDPGPGELPRSACLHPMMLPGSTHPARALCSVGLAFKLAHALVKEGRRAGESAESAYDIRQLLDLVALGTVADLVPLKGENRLLVSAGIPRLRATHRPGLRALMEVADIRDAFGTQEIGFQLAPRINAAGRLESAQPALDLVLAREEAEAERLARRLDEVNRKRQALERQTSDEVLARLNREYDPDRDWVIVEGDSGWHLGVVGIVASRVVREFHRPAVILGGDGDILRGSARSIPGFNLAKAFQACDGVLERGGGHAMAAGLSVAVDHVGALKVRLNELARAELQASSLVPELELDGTMALRDLDLEVQGWLERLEPTGQGNPRASFVFPGVRHARPPRRMGRDGAHALLSLTDSGCSPVSAVCWGHGDASWPEGSFDVAAMPELNHYQGRTTVRLKILDWRQGAGGS